MEVTTHETGKTDAKMFQGLRAYVWAARLKNRDWPPTFADRMAAFLVGEIPEPPEWPERMED